MIYLKYGQLVPGGGWAVERQLGCCSQAPCLLRNAQLRKAFENMRASERARTREAAPNGSGHYSYSRRTCSCVWRRLTQVNSMSIIRVLPQPTPPQR